MKITEQQQAQTLYFQTGLSKSEIADQLGISRTTLHQWIQQNNWDRLKKSGEFIPAFLAENIYMVIGNLTEHILSEERVGKPVTLQEANTMYKLTNTIGKLKTRATLNENMETFAHFTEHLVGKDPSLAQKLQPHINDFIAAQAAPNHKKYQPVTLDATGYIPAPGPISQALEDQLDKEDLEFWSRQEKAKAAQSAAPAQPPAQKNECAAPSASLVDGRSQAPLPLQAVIGANVDRKSIENSIRKHVGGNYKKKHRHAA